MRKNKIDKGCVLLYGYEGDGTLSIERDKEYNYQTLGKGLTLEQAVNLARLFTSKYKKVRLFDDEYEAYLTFRNRTDKPVISSYYPEAEVDVAKKYGLYDESYDRDERDYTDLDKEKWDNYYGDFNQCGIHIDWQ